MNWFERFIERLYNKQATQRQQVRTSKVPLTPSTGETRVKRDPKQMRLSQQGIDLIKVFEGFRAEPYQDQAGVWTIGYGTTGKHVHKKSPPISERDAARLMLDHLDLVQADVRQLVKVPLNQNQFDALVSFAYNVGTDIDDDHKAEGLGDSTLLRYLNKGYIAQASEEFKKWVYAGGKKRKGLYIRRKKECELFLT